MRLQLQKTLEFIVHLESFLEVFIFVWFVYMIPATNVLTNFLNSALLCAQKWEQLFFLRCQMMIC